MSSHAMTPETIAACLVHAQQHVEDALTNLAAAQEAYQKAKQELTWWEEGARMYGLLDARPLTEPDRYLQDLIPDGAVPVKPTLRQAIFFMLRANPHDVWTVAEIAGMLHLNNWLPKTEYQKRIADMAGQMVRDNQMEHVERGKYRLREEWAEALSRHLPISTDYRQAATQALSVPDHPAKNEGLADD